MHENRSGSPDDHGLRVVADRVPGGVPRMARSLVYERVLRETGRRVDRVHRVLRERGAVLPDSLPMDRNLDQKEVEELAWRVYCLACATRVSLLLCPPALVLMAAEWMVSEEPWVFEAFCEMQVAP